MNFEIWSTAERLEKESQAWDDLWRRSDVASPSARAIPLKLWHEHFFPRRPLRAIVVREQGELLAALPLVVDGIWPKLAQIPFNDWIPGGSLLIDRDRLTSANRDAVGDCLAEGVSRFAGHAFWFRNVPWKSAAWQCLIDSLSRRSMPMTSHLLHEVGLVNLRRNWDEIERDFSGNHRRHMRKAMRRAEREGGVEMQILEGCGPDELARQLRTGFDLEVGGWKGQEGTAVVQQPGLFDLIVRQAVELSRDDSVRLVYLRHRERVIAFEYCWKSKGNLLTPKIAYDESFSSLSPGQLLIDLHLRELAASATLDQIDFSGPIADSTRKWCTGFYEAGTVVVGQAGLVGRAIVAAYAWRRARKERAREAAAKTQVESNAEDAAETEVVS